MTELADLVEPYKRAVATPGTFAATFPSTSDEDIEGALADAFGEARLLGFFPSYAIDLDEGVVTPDLSSAGQALLVTLASIQSLRTQLRNTRASVNYEAGPVRYAVQNSASVMSALLEEAQARLAALKDLARPAATGSYMLDRYVQIELGETTTRFALAEVP